MTRPCNSKKKPQRTCSIADFATLVDHREKLKEGEKRDRYLDLSRELKKLWNINVTVIPFIVDAFGTILKKK